RNRLLPRPARRADRRARRHAVFGRLRAERVRLRRHRHRPLLPRLRAARGRGAARGRPPQRDRREGNRRGTRLQAVSGDGKLRFGQVGLGYWGRTLARVFDDVADLTWLCDASDALREGFAGRYPKARTTADFGELLAANDVDAVVIATPVPTHYPLTR